MNKSTGYDFNICLSSIYDLGQYLGKTTFPYSKCITYQCSRIPISRYPGQVKFGSGKVRYLVTLSRGKLKTSYAVRNCFVRKAVIDCGKVDFIFIFPEETSISEKS